MAPRFDWPILVTVGEPVEAFRGNRISSGIVAVGDELIVTTEERSREDVDPGYRGHAFAKGDLVTVVQVCVPERSPFDGGMVDHIMTRREDGEQWYLTEGEWVAA